MQWPSCHGILRNLTIAARPVPPLPVAICTYHCLLAPKHGAQQVPAGHQSPHYRLLRRHAS